MKMSDKESNNEKIEKLGELLNQSQESEVISSKKKFEMQQEEIQREVFDFVKERINRVRKTGELGDTIKSVLLDKVNDLKDHHLIRLFEVCMQLESSESNNLLTLFKPEKETIQPILINDKQKEGDFENINRKDMETMDKFIRFMSDMEKVGQSEDSKCRE
jgi:hypothetical protein